MVTQQADQPFLPLSREQVRMAFMRTRATFELARDPHHKTPQDGSLLKQLNVVVETLHQAARNGKAEVVIGPLSSASQSGKMFDADGISDPTLAAFEDIRSLMAALEEAGMHVTGETADAIRSFNLRDKPDPRVVTLPDGYNGHTLRFYADPVVVDGETVKLRCAEPGKEHMTVWRSAAEVRDAVEDSDSPRIVLTGITEARQMEDRLNRTGQLDKPEVNIVMARHNADDDDRLATMLDRKNRLPTASNGNLAEALQLVRTDTDNCRVYYKRGDTLYAFQRERRDQFQLFECTLAGEPMVPVPMKAIDRHPDDYPEFERWLESENVRSFAEAETMFVAANLPAERYLEVTVPSSFDDGEHTIFDALDAGASVGKAYDVSHEELVGQVKALVKAASTLVQAVEYTPLGIRGIAAVQATKSTLAKLPNSGYLASTDRDVPETFHQPAGVAHLNGQVMAAPEVVAILDKAESFIVGFEGDELQEGIDDLLREIRTASAALKTQRKLLESPDLTAEQWRGLGKGELVRRIEAAGYSASGPTDSRAAENGEPVWVCNAREALAEIGKLVDAEPDLDEDEIRDFLTNRIDSGDMALEDITKMIARYGLMDPKAFQVEMRERMQNHRNEQQDRSPAPGM
ncbi:hypothetical protein LGM58_38520 [Burkholderia contaminans]|uniref:hypothetical protein n=1 Tax=Burkholderia contaminans TaxID=488447 RepID=UPI001CF137D8|nr:hypothetical protein [Burkholderia contaminans]MCA7889079.1 hypothetical protein [Burkholderia contaminans]